MLFYVAVMAAHVLLYVVVLRHRPAFCREAVIFAYHAASAVAISLGAIADALVGLSGIDLYGVAAVIALHGIYSVTFLEMWSLSEGGYSLQIMEHLASAQERGVPVDIAGLEAIGAAKQGNRLEGLARVGLLRLEGDQVELTAVGRSVAATLAGLAWLIDVRDGL